MTAQDNTEKIKPVAYDRKKANTMLCNPEEITQLRSVIASLAWVARQVRLDLSSRVSKLQSMIKGATIKTCKEVNKTLDYAIEK